MSWSSSERSSPHVSELVTCPSYWAFDGGSVTSSCYYAQRAAHFQCFSIIRWPFTLMKSCNFCSASRRRDNKLVTEWHVFFVTFRRRRPIWSWEPETLSGRWHRRTCPTPTPSFCASRTAPSMPKGATWRVSLGSRQSISSSIWWFLSFCLFVFVFPPFGWMSRIRSTEWRQIWWPRWIPRANGPFSSWPKSI